VVGAHEADDTSMNLLRFKPRPASLESVPTRDGGATIAIARGRFIEELVRLGPNLVHAAILYPDGDVKDLGISQNLRTTVGADWQAGAMGGLLPGTLGSPATATSATSLTVTGTPLVAGALVGMRVYADQSTNSPVYGNIGANTTSVITVDQWWNSDDTTGTTPSSNAAFSVGAGGMSAARFIGLTTDASAASAANTALTSEITTNGLQRALALYAHTPGTASYTLSKTFTASGAFTAVHRAGCFTCLTAAAGGRLIFETVLNADATLASGDSIAVTWTVNI
jgi:hypothetical protein